MGKFQDLTGKRFGRLVVIRRAENYITPSGQPQTMWECKCDCGAIKNIRSPHLINGKIISCGCFHKENTSKNNKDIFKKTNRFIIHDNYVELFTNNNESFYVDLEDFERIRDFSWYKNSYGYIVTNYNGKKTGIHRLIMNCPDDMLVDHIHGEQSRNDNRKSNLRIATDSQNNMNIKIKSNNTSGVTGVTYHKRNQKWIATININKRRIYLGSYSLFSDAVKARKEAEEKYFGEWSYDNSQKYNV